MPTGETARIGLRIFRGMLWSYASLIGVRLLVLVLTAVLAHLLSPRDFGLVALALILTTALDAVKDIRLNDALVVASDEDVISQANTAFCLTVLIGVALALVTAVISPLAADFFHRPRLLAFGTITTLACAT